MSFIIIILIAEPIFAGMKIYKTFFQKGYIVTIYCSY